MYAFNVTERNMQIQCEWALKQISQNKCDFIIIGSHKISYPELTNGITLKMSKMTLSLLLPLAGELFCNFASSLFTIAACISIVLLIDVMPTGVTGSSSVHKNNQYIRHYVAENMLYGAPFVLHCIERRNIISVK